MSFAINFPLFSIVLSLVCSVVSSLLPGRAARRLSMALTVAVAAMSGCVLVYIWQTGEPVTYMMGHYPHPWGNEIRMGILEPVLTVAFSVVLFLCVLGGGKHLQSDLQAEKQKFYYVMVDLIQAALLAFAYTNDIFTGYVFVEICTIASCGLLMIRQIGRTTLAAVRYMIFSLIGSGLFLMGVVLLYGVTGHLLMPDLKQTIAQLWPSGQYHTPLVTAVSLITIGLAIKSGLFPFHFWMADTYGCATPCSAGILSGLVSKGYILLLIKIIFNVFGTKVFYDTGMQNVLYILGILGMVVGSVSAIRENDIFGMTAYSSAAQIGYIYMGIGISPTYGIIASLFHMLTHAFTKPALFLSAAQLSDTAGGSKQFKKLQGAAHKNRWAGAAFTVAAFSMIGLPCTMGFISKYLFAVSAFHSNGKIIPTLIALAVSTVLNTFYFARTVIRLYNRPVDGNFRRVGLGEQRSYALAALMFAAGNFAGGVCAQPLVFLLNRGLALM